MWWSFMNQNNVLCSVSTSFNFPKILQKFFCKSAPSRFYRPTHLNARGKISKMTKRTGAHSRVYGITLGLYNSGTALDMYIFISLFRSPQKGQGNTSGRILPLLLPFTRKTTNNFLGGKHCTQWAQMGVLQGHMILMKFNKNTFTHVSLILF